MWLHAIRNDAGFTRWECTSDSRDCAAEILKECAKATGLDTANLHVFSRELPFVRREL